MAASLQLCDTLTSHLLIPKRPLTSHLLIPNPTYRTVLFVKPINFLVSPRRRLSN
jgi:hypothetical protein